MQKADTLLLLMYAIEGIKSRYLFIELSVRAGTIKLHGSQSALKGDYIHVRRLWIARISGFGADNDHPGF